MKQMILLFLCFFQVSLLSGQYQQRPLISATGFQGQAAGYYIDFSVGDLMVGNFSAAGFQFYAGFHQPPSSASSNEDLSPSGDMVILYPNPTSGLVHVRMNEKTFNDFDWISLTDLKGVDVMFFRKGNVNSNPFVISLDELTPGVFFFRLHYSIGSVKVIKIIYLK